MSRDTATEAVVDHLNALGILTGRGRAPEGGGWVAAPGQSAFTPYAIVWRIGASDLVSHALDGEYSEERPMFHIRTVGGTPSEADGLLDDIDDAMLNQPLVVPGRRVTDVLFDVSITTSRDDDVNPPVFYTGAYYRLELSEA